MRTFFLYIRFIRIFIILIIFISIKTAYNKKNRITVAPNVTKREQSVVKNDYLFFLKKKMFYLNILPINAN